MPISDIVTLLLQLGQYLVKALGHSNEELKAEFAKQLGEASEARKTWEEWIAEKGLLE